MRLSKYPANWNKKIKGHQVIWIHIASLGEFNAIRKIIDTLKKDFLNDIVVISTITEAGYKKACEEYGKDFVILAPLDIFFVVRNSLNFFKPKILLIAETELWPNLILEAKRKNIKICLINARITKRSIKYYSYFNDVSREIMNSIDKYCVQNIKEENNFLNLGIKKEKITVCGQTKFDIKTDIPVLDQKKLKQDLGLGQNDFLFVAGSTRPGEENILLDAFADVRKIKSCKLILAPRHPDRTMEIVKIIEQKSLPYCKLSTIGLNPINNIDIFILDCLGKLTLYYSIANLAFVGGTLQDFGGHNLIEPAFFSCPVIFGPYVDNARDMAKLLISSDSGKCVKDKNAIKKVLLEYLDNPDLARSDGAKAFQAVNENSGASNRTLNEIKKLLGV